MRILIELQILIAKILLKFYVKKDISPALKKLNQIPMVSGHPVFPLHLETKNSIPAFSALLLPSLSCEKDRQQKDELAERKERTNRWDQNRRSQRETALF